MNIIFFGSSEFSIPFLDAFKEHVVLIITTQDKLRGRGSNIKPNPVKKFALSIGKKVLAIEKLDETVFVTIRQINPDFFLVVSFGKIIPERFLKIPKCPLNLHPSALPLYRGASPIERQIMDGVTFSKVCIMKITKDLDAGEIIAEAPLIIEENDTKKDVEEKIISIGIPLLKEAIEIIYRVGCIGKPQIGIPTYAMKITKKDEIIDWNENNISVHNRIRALNPVPGAYTLFRGKILKIYKSEPNAESSNEKPGTILKIDKSGFLVQCGKMSLKVLKVKPEGKREMKAIDFINGYKLKVGEKFEKAYLTER